MSALQRTARCDHPSIRHSAKRKRRGSLSIHRHEWASTFRSWRFHGIRLRLTLEKSRVVNKTCAKFDGTNRIGQRTLVIDQCGLVSKSWQPDIIGVGRDGRVGGHLFSAFVEVFSSQSAGDHASNPSLQFGRSTSCNNSNVSLLFTEGFGNRAANPLKEIYHVSADLCSKALRQRLPLGLR